MKQVYLDYAAATPLDPGVLKAMQPFLTNAYFNPSADYAPARAVAHQLTAARKSVANVLGAKPAEIVFTAGGSEANNLAVKGVMEAFPKAKLLVSAIEHDSLLVPASRYSHASVRVDSAGRIDLADLVRRLNDRVVLVSIIYASNEVGTIEPLKQVAGLLGEIKRQRRNRGNELPLYFHSDACQAANYLDLHVNRLGVDLMTLNGGKLYGPKQSGALFVKGGTRLLPLIDGGGQEFGLRSGTENVAAAVGFAAALTRAQQIRGSEVRRLSALRNYFIRALRQTFKGVVINGSLKQRLPNNVHVTFVGRDNERLLFGLDQRGILVAAGSACSASKTTPSQVLLAMGLGDDAALSSLRFSLGRQTNEADIDRTITVLKTLLN